MQLSKGDKKVAVQLIRKGMQKEFAQGMAKFDAILQEWKNKPNHQEAYLKLYKEVKEFDKHIARRYDAMSGSDYFFIVGAQFSEGLLEESDLEEFSPETQQKLFQFSKLQKD
jgi:hypothetical protein